jgi:hypothetical protein
MKEQNSKTNHENAPLKYDEAFRGASEIGKHERRRFHTRPAESGTRAVETAEFFWTGLILQRRTRRKGNLSLRVSARDIVLCFLLFVLS